MRLSRNVIVPPKQTLQPGKQLQDVLSHDLSTYSTCARFGEFAAGNFLGKCLRQALSSEFGRAVNAPALFVSAPQRIRLALTSSVSGYRFRPGYDY